MSMGVVIPTGPKGAADYDHLSQAISRAASLAYAIRSGLDRLVEEETWKDYERRTSDGGQSLEGLRALSDILCDLQPGIVERFFDLQVRAHHGPA